MIDPDLRALVTARLRLRRAEGRLTSAEVRAAATGLAVSERTVWRWLGVAPESSGSGRPRYELTEADRDAYARLAG